MPRSTAPGLDTHLRRLEQARREKQDKIDRMNGPTGARWTGATTKPVAPILGIRRAGAIASLARPLDPGATLDPHAASSRRAAADTAPTWQPMPDADDIDAEERLGIRPMADVPRSALPCQRGVFSRRATTAVVEGVRAPAAQPVDVAIAGIVGARRGGLESSYARYGDDDDDEHDDDDDARAAREIAAGLDALNDDELEALLLGTGNPASGGLGGTRGGAAHGARGASAAATAGLLDILRNSGRSGARGATAWGEDVDPDAVVAEAAAARHIDGGGVLDIEGMGLDGLDDLDAAELDELLDAVGVGAAMDALDAHLAAGRRGR